MSDDSSGEARYHIQNAIGRGGSGHVFRAWDRHLGRYVAIKRIHEGVDVEEAIRRESAILAALHHPNIVTIYDFATDETGPFAVMEYVEGRTLEEIAGRRKLSVAQFVELANQVCRGLSAAHSRGLIHLDLKPGNIMLQEHEDRSFTCKILDFGLAAIQHEEMANEEQFVVGSPYTIAPEQLRKESVDARTDIYSLGCLFYFALSGRYPFEGEEVKDVVRGHLHETATPVHLVAPDVPEKLSRVIAKMMTRDPVLRPRSAEEVRRLVNTAVPERSGSSRPAPALKVSSESAAPKAKSRRWRPVWIALLLPLIAAAVFFILRPNFLPFRIPGISESGRAIRSMFGANGAPKPLASPPPRDPLEWIVGNQENWPETVGLKTGMEFPLVHDGTVVGSAEVPAGTAVKVVAIDRKNVSVVFRGGGRRVPIEATDLVERAQAEAWNKVWKSIERSAEEGAAQVVAGTDKKSAGKAKGRALHPLAVDKLNGSDGGEALDVRAQQVWTGPDQPTELLVTVPKGKAFREARLELSIETPLGSKVHTASYKCKPGENRIEIPPLHREGGFLTKVTVTRDDKVLGSGRTVLSVVGNVADDLRYGFYARYSDADGNYEAKADMLARLHINAVEYYDYFPAHGYYAPREANYHFEPFGIEINALDVQRKIAGGHERNILSLAYVAAYSASESIYRKHPDPMTDERGVPKIFNREIMPEDQADREGRQKWFWIMNIAADSDWYSYIMGEFARTLDNNPGDLVSFDGFEIDSYGDSPDSKFYAKSQRSGDPLPDVLRDFVREVQRLTHSIKPYGLVTFNSSDEFGIEQMRKVTDFLFIEIWRGHTDQLEGLVDVCFRNRAPERQRVILKLYPADMEPSRDSWPGETLRRVLGAAMTGGGSLMVVGEPDEQNGTMNALSTLYYPDYQPLSSGNEKILRSYYGLDALLLGYTHGPEVYNTDIAVQVPNSVTRTYASRSKRALVVQILHVGDETKWSVDVPPSSPLLNQEVTIDLPGGIGPKAVYFASPDVKALQTPVAIDFEVVDGKLRTLIPELRVHGTLILDY